MKKVLAVVLASMMVLSLAACGGDKKEETQAPDTQAATTEAAAEETDATEADTTEAAAESSAAETQAAAPAGDYVADVNGDGKIIVGYISKNLTDVFHIAINEHAKTTFDQWAADGKIDEWTGILDGETDPNKQIDHADTCISRGCDFVIILPAEKDASDPAVTKMADAGINVLCVNSDTTSTPDRAVALTISDDTEAGRMLANWVVENCPDGGKYVHCQGAQGNSAQIARGEGMHEVMDPLSQFELVSEQYNVEWSADSAVNQATDALTKYGDELVAVICDNDDMSSAVQRYMNQQGRSDVVCVGVDGNEGPIQMVANGEMGATIKQDGVGQLQAAMDIITAIIEGKEWSNDPIPFVLVTKDNAAEYLK